MGKSKDEDYVKCNTCEEEILEDDAIYVRGTPYCEKHYRKAEEYGTYEEDYEEHDDDDDDDDDDGDDDDD